MSLRESWEKTMRDTSMESLLPFSRFVLHRLQLTRWRARFSKWRELLKAAASRTIVGLLEGSTFMRRNWRSGRRIQWLPLPVRREICRGLQHLYRYCFDLEPDPYRQRSMNAVLNDFETLNQTATVLSFPRRMYFELTRRCNLRCFMCPHTFEPILQEDIDVQLLDKLLKWLKACDSLWLHGLGESLLRNDLAEIPPWIGTGLVTNGTLLTEDKARALLERPLDHLRVSIDAASEETYARIRGEEHLGLVLKNLRRLKQLQASAGVDRPLVDIVFVAMRENIRELPQLVRIAAQEGIPMITVQRLTVYDDSYSGQSLWWEKDLFNQVLLEAKLLAEELGVFLGGHGGFAEKDRGSTEMTQPGLVKNWGECLEPWVFMYVMNTGEVNGCTYPAPILGDLNKEDPAEIWNGPRFRSWRRTVNNGNTIDFCRYCPHPNNQCAENSYQLFVPLKKLNQWGRWDLSHSTRTKGQESFWA